MLMLGMGSLAPSIPRAPKTDLSGFVKRVWLLLYGQGGYWTIAEIRRSLHVYGGDVHTRLDEMVQRKQIERKRIVNIDGERVSQYFVTRKCTYPRGLAVEEVEALDKGKTPGVAGLQ